MKLFCLNSYQTIIIIINIVWYLDSKIIRRLRAFYKLADIKKIGFPLTEISP
jgi:hypothetical protein